LFHIESNLKVHTKNNLSKPESNQTNAMTGATTQEIKTAGGLSQYGWEGYAYNEMSLTSFPNQQSSVAISRGFKQGVLCEVDGQ
jgi:hypothetical protein